MAEGSSGTDLSSKTTFRLDLSPAFVFNSYISLIETTTPITSADEGEGVRANSFEMLVLLNPLLLMLRSSSTSLMFV